MRRVAWMLGLVVALFANTGCSSSNGSSNDAASSPDVATGSDGAGVSCDVGCTRSATGTFCLAREVEWMCEGAPDPMFAMSCRDPATAVQRFCCPPSFLSQCR